MKRLRKAAAGLATILTAFSAVVCGGSHDDTAPEGGGSDASVTPGEDASADSALEDVLTDGGQMDSGDSAPSEGGAPTRPFDWVGVIGTGQSLSIGATAAYLTTTQPFHNLKLVDTGRDPKYPIYPDAGAPAWAAVPLVEPIRAAVPGDGGGYGDGQYPDNIAGETPHSGMANTLTSLWQTRGGEGEYITAHTVVGWSGHCLSDIDKEGGKRAYPASLEEARVYTSLASAAGKTFGYGGIILTHGECDHTNPAYGTGLYQMWTDYNADLKVITGQTRDVVLLVSQESAVVGGAGGSAVQVWQESVAHPGQVVVTGPKYQYGYNPGLLHLPAPGYEQLGEKYAEVFDQIVNQGVAWKAVEPNHLSRVGAVITMTFDVPNPPLVWDSHMALAHQTANTPWKDGKGFEVSNGGVALTIADATISGSSVVLTLSSDPGSAAKVTVGYAITQDGDSSQDFGGTAQGLVGSLRDSDPFVGWDAETVTVNVTKGSTAVTGAAGAFARRAVKDIVTSGATGITADTVIAAIVSETQLTLSAPWTGPTGSAQLSFRHDEYNYCVHFSMSE